MGVYTRTFMGEELLCNCWYEWVGYVGGGEE